MGRNLVNMYFCTRLVRAEIMCVSPIISSDDGQEFSEDAFCPSSSRYQLHGFANLEMYLKSCRAD